jgi:hypothetical protein
MRATRVGRGPRHIRPSPPPRRSGTRPRFGELRSDGCARRALARSGGPGPDCRRECRPDWRRDCRCGRPCVRPCVPCVPCVPCIRRLAHSGYPSACTTLQTDDHSHRTDETDGLGASIRQDAGSPGDLLRSIEHEHNSLGWFGREKRRLKLCQRPKLTGDHGR